MNIVRALLIPGGLRHQLKAKPGALIVAAFTIVAVLLLAGRHMPGPQSARQASRLTERNPVQEGYAKLPITFVENSGQTNDRVRYFARGTHYAFFLTPDEVVLSLMKASRRAAREEHPISRKPGFMVNARYSNAGMEEPSQEGIALALQFIGANSAVRIIGTERAQGSVNYIRGTHPSESQTGLPHYMEVVYSDLWPGVDLRLRETDGDLKYEFHVQPGARIEDIRLAYRGASSLALDSTGALVIQTGLGPIRDAAPVSFQEIDGVRRPVESHYLLQGRGNSYGFRVGAYQPEHELIIDPGVEYSTFLGEQVMSLRPVSR